jgi:hypothetical protein
MRRNEGLMKEPEKEVEWAKMSTFTMQTWFVWLLLDFSSTDLNVPDLRCYFGPLESINKAITVKFD